MAAAKNQQIVELPVEIVDIGNNCRNHQQEFIDRIARSIEQIGQITPGTTTAKLEVFEGIGRVLALRKLERPTFRTAIIESSMSRSAWRVAQMSTSIHSEKLSDWQLFDNIVTLGMRTDWKQVDLARHLAVDEPTISRWLSPSKTTEKCRDALKDGLISFTHTMRLARLPYEEQDEVLDGILTRAISNRDQLDQVVRERTKKPSKNGHKSEVKRFKATLTDSAMSVALSGKSLGLAEIIDALSELLKLARQAEKKQWDVKTFERVLRNPRNDGQQGSEAA
ncbi:MAG TPA: hypothetical protein VHC22_16290 [Pirellulales bacterium]|nr:hypothetical protein [Pirellulales bacterium]